MTSALDKPSIVCASCRTTSTRMPFAERDSAGKEKNKPPQYVRNPCASMVGQVQCAGLMLR
jgi:hypothetical protein